MIITIDEKQIDLQMRGNELLEDVIKGISQEVETGLCITRIFLDGNDITGQDSRRSSQVKDFDRLDVITGSARDLAYETIASLEDFHTSLVKEFARSSDEFRMGDEDLSNQILMRCLDGLRIFIRMTISAANLLQVDLKGIEAGELSVMATIEKINELLDEMIEAQTQNDSILLADLIEYELQPLLEDWPRGFDALKKLKEAV